MMTAYTKATAAVVVLALAVLPGASAANVNGPGFSFKMKGVVGRWVPEEKKVPKYEYYLVERDASHKKATKGDGSKNPVRMTQHDAKRRCEAMGATLPSIHSADEHRQLINLMDGNKHGFWVGAERDAVKSKNAGDFFDHDDDKWWSISSFGFDSVDTDNDNDAWDLMQADAVSTAFESLIDYYYEDDDYVHYYEAYFTQFVQADFDRLARYYDTVLPDESATGHGTKDKWANLDSTAWNYDNWAPGEPSYEVDQNQDFSSFYYNVDSLENCVYSGGGSRKNKGNPSLFYDAKCQSRPGARTKAPKMKVICKREIDPPDVSHFETTSFGSAMDQGVLYGRSARLLNDVAAGATSIELGPAVLPKVHIGDRIEFTEADGSDDGNRRRHRSWLHNNPETNTVYITGVDPVAFQPPLSRGFSAGATITHYRRRRCSVSDDCATRGFCFSGACWDTSLRFSEPNVCDIVATFGNTDDGWAQEDLLTDPNWRCEYTELRCVQDECPAAYAACIGVSEASGPENKTCGEELETMRNVNQLDLQAFQSTWYSPEMTTLFDCYDRSACYRFNDYDGEEEFTVTCPQQEDYCDCSGDCENHGNTWCSCDDARAVDCCNTANAVDVAEVTLLVADEVPVVDRLVLIDEVAVDETVVAPEPDAVELAVVDTVVVAEAPTTEAPTTEAPTTETVTYEYVDKGSCRGAGGINDIINLQPPDGWANGDLEDCKAACSAVPSCTGIDYKRASNQCELASAPIGLQTKRKHKKHSCYKKVEPADVTPISK
jgi:hypothetical protein